MKIELQKSSLLVMKAWTTISRDCLSRQVRIRQIFLRCQNDVLHSALTCFPKERMSSKTTPILRQDVDGVMLSSPTVRFKMSGLGENLE